MILFDCGNQRVKAQCWRDDQLYASCSIAYRGGWQKPLQDWLENVDAAPVFIVSVLDTARQAQFEALLQARFSRITRYASQAWSLNLSNAYTDPESLGDDRWLALLGADALVTGDCVVIDAGSAITLDLLRTGGRHLGGAILPGFNTSIAGFKQIFNYIDFDHPAIAKHDAPGCSTECAIQLDYAHCPEETLLALVQRWSQHYLTQPAILLTGGDAARVQRLFSSGGRIVPDLVFRGLRRLASQ